MSASSATSADGLVTGSPDTRTRPAVISSCACARERARPRAATARSSRTGSALVAQPRSERVLDLVEELGLLLQVRGNLRDRSKRLLDLRRELHLAQGLAPLLELTHAMTIPPTQERKKCSKSPLGRPRPRLRRTRRGAGPSPPGRAPRACRRRRARRSPSRARRRPRAREPGEAPRGTSGRRR